MLIEFVTFRASIVRRGSDLASEFAKNFKFKKLEVVCKTMNMNVSLRKSFVKFAMSFLWVGAARKLMTMPQSLLSLYDASISCRYHTLLD